MCNYNYNISNKQESKYYILAGCTNFHQQNRPYTRRQNNAAKVINQLTERENAMHALGDMKKVNFVRFQFLTAASMKMAVFRVVAPCRLVGVY
jgi:hypothetical protein